MTVARRSLLQSLPAVALATAAGPASAQAGPALARIAFGSCADQRKAQPIWQAVEAYRPELMLFLGDNVYGDAYPYSGATLRAAYARADTIEAYVRIRRETPHVQAIWDDHDYGANDGGADFEGKQDAKDAFLDFWRLPADDPRVQSIKITLYRTSGDSAIARSLIRAAERGVQVAALVELKARFDEATNVPWAKARGRAGVHVV